MRRFFPYPMLSALIILMWLLLSGFSIGQFLVGCMVSVFVSAGMVNIKPKREKIHNWWVLPLLLFRVMLDITRSNLAVAFIILSAGYKKYNSGFIVIPLDLKNRAGLVFLAGILTATPGTVWIAYDVKNSELVLHVLDLMDETYWNRLVKNRYERLLMEMFK